MLPFDDVIMAYIDLALVKTYIDKKHTSCVSHTPTQCSKTWPRKCQRIHSLFLKAISRSYQDSFVNSLVSRRCGARFKSITFITKNTSLVSHCKIALNGNAWWDVNIGSGDGLVSSDTKPLNTHNRWPNGIRVRIRNQWLNVYDLTIGILGKISRLSFVILTAKSGHKLGVFRQLSCRHVHTCDPIWSLFFK